MRRVGHRLRAANRYATHVCQLMYDRLEVCPRVGATHGSAELSALMDDAWEDRRVAARRWNQLVVACPELVKAFVQEGVQRGGTFGFPEPGRVRVVLEKGIRECPGVECASNRMRRPVRGS